MRIPFRIERAPAAPTEALVVSSREPGFVLSLVRQLGHVPRIFALGDGLLLVLARPRPRALAGTIGLRAIGPDLYVPASGRLVPALLDDEARELGRARGLVFLSGGALGFDRSQPVPLGRFVAAHGLVRGSFRSFPERPPRADRVRELLLARDETPESVIEGAAPPAAEAPPEESTGDEVPGGASVTAGRGLKWLGEKLGLEKLEKLGKSWMEKGAARSPGASESVHGKQEAQLRWLLRELREGDAEKALGRALPLGDPTSGGPSAPSASTSLPQHDVRWSLPGALEGAGGGGRAWMGGLSLQMELAREYRKLAEKAVADGDHRRAAFLYGKLLRDWRSAAQALEAGGLHHDAAVILLTKLKDVRHAAKQFEAAGEHDRALALYREQKDHQSAGWLLERMGEHDLAVEEFRAAADHVVKTGSDRRFVDAADLLLKAARRPDLAIETLERGWKMRPLAEGRPCLAPLVALHAEARAGGPLLRIMKEAEEHFEYSDGSTAPFQAFGQLSRAAERLDDAAAAGDLRDRARLAIARELAMQRRSPLELSSLLSGAALGDAVVADALHAVRRARGAGRA